MRLCRLVLAWIALCSVAWGEPAAVEGLGAGRFLVAEEQVLDPNFARTVVLLIDYGPRGAMGLIVNRPSRRTLAEALPRFEALAGSKHRLFFGGPVEPEALLLLLRSDDPPAGFEEVLNGVYLGGSASKWVDLIGSGLEEDSVRGYAGYAGWGPGQLDNEVSRGDWSVLPAAAGQVFDPAPDSLWKKLMERRRIRFARGW